MIDVLMIATAGGELEEIMPKAMFGSNSDDRGKKKQVPPCWHQVVIQNLNEGGISGMPHSSYCPIVRIVIDTSSNLDWLT
jgi:hypothetical protein